MNKCRYHKQCKEFGFFSCKDDKYCGLKESFMAPKERKKYQKKHLGKEIKKKGLMI